MPNPSVSPGTTSTPYDAGFAPPEGYNESLPDPQNAGGEAWRCPPIALGEVGSSSFHLPLSFPRRDAPPLERDVSVTGLVSLSPDRKGINMSRVIRTIYDFRQQEITAANLRTILAEMRTRIGAERARLDLRFQWPLWQASLRSDLGGYQYYPMRVEAIASAAEPLRLFWELDFTYSSACPCAADLALHAAATRGVSTVPHSQRSRARLRIQLQPEAGFFFEDLIALAANALHTETQVMVRRVDEQAFAELNGSYLKFVEDAARLLFQALDSHPAIADFCVSCSHLESLHSHNAVASVCKGIPGGLSDRFEDYDTLIC